jgi:hypothetical protein
MLAFNLSSGNRRPRDIHLDQLYWLL